jgi:hypothetical protein
MESCLTPPALLAKQQLQLAQPPYENTALPVNGGLWQDEVSF